MTCKRCFFIGHRDATSEILPQLKQAIQTHISEYGVTEFIVGNHGMFDHLAASAVLSAKKVHPDIVLTLLSPYHPSNSNIKRTDIFDTVFYPDGMEKVPLKYAIIKANEYTIRYVDYLIAFVWHTASNSQKIVEYAQRREKRGLIKVTVLKV